MVQTPAKGRARYSRCVYGLAISFLILACGVLRPGQVQAYPNYITYGYKNCGGCHYNPFGNGPLTDYGRVVAATEIAEDYFISNGTDEGMEKLAESSMFLGGLANNSTPLRPAINYRGLGYFTEAGFRSVLMDASASLAAGFMEDEKLTIVLQLAYSPKEGLSGMDQFRSRESYVGYKINDHFGVYAGLMDKAFGIRVPDHIAFSRIFTRNAQDDQVHGVLLHYTSEQYEIGIQPFLGNMLQDSQIRHKGVSAIVEHAVGERIMAGGSGVVSMSDVTTLVATAGHVRLGYGEGHALLSELGGSVLISDVADRVSLYALVQNFWKIRRGIYGLLTLEHGMVDTSAESFQAVVGPGIQYFPMQRVEYRLDGYYRFNQTGNGDWAISSQLHFWL